MAFLINGSPIITNDRDLSQVGIATVTEDVNIGRLLYDANGNVGLGNSILVTKDGTLQWEQPSTLGISTGGDQILESLQLTGPDTALTVDNDAAINGNLIMGSGSQIHGPNILVIDPEVVGDNTGEVVIRGDLVVEGTEFIINSETLNISDKKIGLATNITSEALLEGSGFTIGKPGTSVEKSFLYDFASDSFQSSVGIGVTTGGAFVANGDVVLTRDTLGTTVVNSSLTSVGTLNDLTVSGDITANGNIVGDDNTNISGIASVTADNFYGDGSGLTNIQSGSVDLTGTDQSLNSLVVTGPGIGLTVDNSVSVGQSITANTMFAQEYDSLSDRSLKENIQTLPDALGKLSSIRGVSYTWKNNGKSTIGVIAQEVMEVYPELITEGEHLTVNYNGLTGVLIRAVKELSEKVAELEAKLEG